ncbi:YidC/Oxa1 family membrane protein insertase [Caproicibacter sp.]|uniref:YidC/Oxa1 family membrane protein insertase n=1 Tax=Caproicibacter sp. TaxID=2814884 RepID=UPI003989800C
MYDFFNIFGSALGYLLWYFYELVRNYGVAIILFTVVTKILLFPFSVKQQISMAANSKIASKQKELQKKYAKDRERLQIETQKLYEKEGINPASGCLTMIVPLVIMMGLYYTVLYPLINALHVSGTAANAATDMLKLIPGIGQTLGTRYGQIEIVKHFADLKPYLTMFSADELARIQDFSHGFSFLGLNLLDTPSDPANIFGTLFRSNLWVIPVLCFVSSLVTQFFTMKLQPGMQQQQGCMKGMFYIMPLFTAWIACSMPAAVGFYWIISTITGFLQTVILNIWYSPADLSARAEARRVALRELEEANMKPVAIAAGNRQNDDDRQKKTGKPRK